MIFATDLDRTLIHSEKFLEGFAGEVLHVEIFKEQPISYISKESIQLLRALNEVATIIPITTRNKEQYDRIQLFKGDLSPKTYVVNNGGTIFSEGKEDMEWSQLIKKQLKQLTVSYEEALEKFLSLYKGPVEHYKKSDDLIWLILSDKQQIDWQAVRCYEEQMKGSGWRIDVNERKIYLYPACVNKEAALKYLHQKNLSEPVIAAGDSLFDCEMVRYATHGLVPKASWLEAAFLEGEKEPSIYITNEAGLGATEELLRYALNKSMIIKKIHNI